MQDSGGVMLDRKTIEKLGGWEGYRVERIAWPEGDSRTVTVYLKPSARTMYCAHCGSRCRQVHDSTTRRVRDLPLMAFRVVLVVPRRRVWCARCGGPRLEKLSWLGKMDSGSLKMKVAASIVAISSIHLLKVFMDAKNIEPVYLKWYVIIHMTFVVSAFAMGYLDKLTKHDH